MTWPESRPVSIFDPFKPPIRAARDYSFYKLRKDLVAGLTVAVVEVPQAMAYALIAGVPPQYGIYTSIIQGILGALLSSCEHLTTGPTNTQSLLIASAVTRVAGMSGYAVGGPEYVQIYLGLVFALTLIKGLIQLGFAALRMGDMVRYVSRSVIVGVASGAGVLIIAGQIAPFLGVEMLPRSKDEWWGIIGIAQRVIPNLDQIHGGSVAMGLLTIGIVLGLRWINRLLPGALMAVIVTAVIVAMTGIVPDAMRVQPIETTLPQFSVPGVSLGDARELLGGALALAMLGMLESVAIGKTLASKAGERINSNQEFFAQGLTNAVSSFFQCIPGSGSFSRSALDYDAGAQSRFAAVFNAIFVALIFFLFASQAQYIPYAALAGVLFVIAAGLIDWRYMVRIARSSRSDGLVCITTFVATLIAPLEYAIFVGILLNIGLFLRKASRLHLSEMVQAHGGPFIERPIHDRLGNKQVIFLQLEGDLFFAVADELQDRLQVLSRSGVRVVIFRLKRTHMIDTTVLDVFEDFIEDMRKRNGCVIFCGVKTELMTILKRYGLVDLVGRENVFPAGDNVFSSAKAALARARELVAQSIDLTPIQEELSREEAITYEI